MMISSSTGALIKVDSNTVTSRDDGDIALWVTDPAHEGDVPMCDITVDALFNYPTQKYRIDNWVYLEQSVGSLGSMVNEIDIYDLELFVAYAFDMGIWNQPLDCDAIWRLVKDQIIYPMMQYEIQDQQRPSISARVNGIEVNVKCRPNPESPYVPCNWQYLYENQHIIAVHTSKLREYK